jgi:cation:H+ antiporter
MDSIIISVLSLLILFYFLGKAAALAIVNLRAIAEKLGIGIFFLGLVMGFFTSFPEIAIGINAIINDVQNISLGNLFGGHLVLFGLILGSSIFLQRKIKSEQNIFQMVLIFIFLLIPLVLGMNGTLGVIEGLIIIFCYFILLFFMYHKQNKKMEMPHLVSKRDLTKNIFLFLLGIVLVLVIANFTIKITNNFLSLLPLSKFVVGILIFAIGTNFPEIIVAIRAWKNKVKGLSMSNLLGSGMANMLIVGVFSVIKPFQVNIDISYYILIGGLVVLFTLVLIFYYTGLVLKRGEGIVLILVYFSFIILQIIFEKPVIGLDGV